MLQREQDNWNSQVLLLRVKTGIITTTDLSNISESKNGSAQQTRQDRKGYKLYDCTCMKS
jgi:hypothetical protein